KGGYQMSSNNHAGQSLSRRQLLKMLGIGAASVGLAACAPVQPGAAPSAGSAGQAPQSQEPVAIEYWFIADTPREAEMYGEFFTKFQEQYPDIQLSTDQPPSIGELRTKL